MLSIFTSHVILQLVPSRDKFTTVNLRVIGINVESYIFLIKMCTFENISS